jgi:DNA-binding FrmR family transcriptional regulator
MKIENQETKEQLIKRLKRIEGQVRGLQSMLDDERECREIMQQLSAVSAAVKSTSRTFFHDYAALCLTDIGEDPESNQDLLSEMMALLDKTP